MNTIEDTLTAEDAKAILDRDARNRIERISTRKGTLSEHDRRRYHKIIKRAAIKRRREQAPPPDKRLAKIDPKGFEGTYAQNQRRRKVYMLRLRNFTIREMAEELQCGTNSVMRDLKHIDQALQKQIDPINATAFINEALLDYEAVRLMASEAIMEAEGMERNGYMNTILKATELKIALLQDAGTLPTAHGRAKALGADDPTPTGATHVHISISPYQKGRSPVKFQVIDVAAEQRAA